MLDQCLITDLLLVITVPLVQKAAQEKEKVAGLELVEIKQLSLELEGDIVKL